MEKSHRNLLFSLFCLLAALLAPDAAPAGTPGREVWGQRGCAKCHGDFAQGRIDRNVPRLAGTPTDYLRRRLLGHPAHPHMEACPGASRLSFGEIDALVADLADLDLRGDPRFDVHAPMGDPGRGEQLYRDECRICHGKGGYGKEARGEQRAMPPLAGQIPGYLLRAMRQFQLRQRVHDDTPDDDLFDQLNGQELQDLIAYLATLDDLRPSVSPNPAGP